MKGFGLRIMIPLILFCGSDIARAKDFKAPVISLSKDLVAKLEKGYVSDTKELDEKVAEDFIRKLGEEAFEIIRTEKIDSTEVEKGFHLLLKSRFGLTSIAGFAIGPTFKELNKEEKERVANGCLLKDLYNQFLSKFADYKKSTFVVTGSKKKSYRHVEVESVLTAKQAQKIIWSVYLSKGSIKVYDVFLDGVSASNILRSVYADRMKKDKNFWKN